MKKTFLVIFHWVVLGFGTLFATDLADVMANPEKYEGRHVELIGIARVPGYFYLCADEKAAADRHPSTALLIRRTNFTQPEYRELDRQWVRVAGVMSSKECGGCDPGTGVVLEHVELLRDRPVPRIPDRTVLGIFKNATTEPLAVQLVPSSEGEIGTIFFLKPSDVDETEISEGRAVASKLKGAKNISLDKREIGTHIASGKITFSGLSTDYQYSPESSDKRRLYFRILGNRIESVAASQAREWKN